MHLPSWGSFEGWSRVVRNTLAWLDQADPAVTRQELVATADTEKLALKHLIDGWWDMFGLAGGTVARALKRIEEDSREFVPAFRGLAAAINELVPAPPGRPTSGRSLGRKLQQVRGRVVGGLTIDRRPVESAAGIVWYVRSAQSVASGLPGLDGFGPTPYAGEVGGLCIGGEQNKPSEPGKPMEAPRRRKRSEFGRARDNPWDV